MQTLTQAAAPTRPTTSTSASRAGVLTYGLASYAIGMAGLMWLITACLGLVPFTGGPVAFESTGAAIAFNLIFVLLFGVQHAIMARPAFKRRWTQVIPAAIERSTFVLVTGVIMCATMLLWQPLTQTVWAIESESVGLAVRGFAVIGALYLVSASFAIDHFELFGLKQVWTHFRGSEMRKLPVVSRWMYRFDRHPIMTGMLIVLWSTPVMRLDHLVLAAGFTAYIVIGVLIEERTLVEVHGDGYRVYRRKVAALVPFPGRRA